MRRVPVAIGAGILLLSACGKSAQHPHHSLAAGAGGEAAGAPSVGGAGAETSTFAGGEAGTTNDGGVGGAAEAGTAGEP
jgi:hypothetical protein